ncbi:hypothetical protein OG738_29630 [Amycolatopsis sp. NBC_01488]|nr:hypothetical protein [Amycolatopsis sp. NBC_01488]
MTTEDFRYFLKNVYGPAYEPPIDAIVQISFESEETMREALHRAPLVTP